MNEAQLVQRTREGDADAFADIYRAYQVRIYNYVYRLVKDAHDAEDLTQESFLKAYRALSRGDEPRNLSAWLYRIASNTCMDALRRRSLIRWQPLGNLLSILGNVTARAPEDEVLKQEQRAERQADVERILAELPPRYRMYLLLREREGFSYQEIAAITGDSMSTVKVTLCRARERARSLASNPALGSEQS